MPKKYTGPSPRQQDALDAIKKYKSKHGFPPTRVELAGLLDISTNAAVNLLSALENKGCIKLTPGVPRGMKVLI